MDTSFKFCCVFDRECERVGFNKHLQKNQHLLGTGITTKCKTCKKSYSSGGICHNCHVCQPNFKNEPTTRNDCSIYMMEIKSEKHIKYIHIKIKK